MRRGWTTPTGIMEAPEPIGGFYKFGDWVNGGVLGHRRGTRDPGLLPARQVRGHPPLGRAGHEMGQGLPHGRPLVAARREHQQSVVRFRAVSRRRRGRDDRQLRHSRRDDPRTVRLRVSFATGSILRPRVPGSITEYVQKQPVRFGEKTPLPFLPQRRTEGQIGHGQRQAVEG